MAAPIWDPMPTHVNERPSSFVGNQRDITIIQLGYVPDSPIPNKNLTTNKPARPDTKPVSPVKRDQNKTMRIKTFRGPIRSPYAPEGISNKAYAKANDANTHPNCSLLR